MSDTPDPIPTSVIAKLNVHTKSGDTTGTLYLGGVYDSNKAEREDSLFGDTTPSASLNMSIMNPPAFAFFEQGQAYYTLFVGANGIDYRQLVAVVNAEVERQRAAATGVEG